MTTFDSYRFPAFIFLSLLFIVFLCIRGIVINKTVVISSKTVTKSGTGVWGAFSYDVNIADKRTGKKYVRTYRNFCISNLFFDLDEIKKSPAIYLAIPASEVNRREEVTFYSVTPHPVSAVKLFFSMLSYLVSNMPYVFLAPVLVSAGLFQKEFSKDYCYESRLHKQAFTASFYIIIIFSVFSAIY